MYTFDLADCFTPVEVCVNQCFVCICANIPRIQNVCYSIPVNYMYTCDLADCFASVEACVNQCLVCICAIIHRNQNIYYSITIN